MAAPAGREASPQGSRAGELLLLSSLSAQPDWAAGALCTSLCLKMPAPPSNLLRSFSPRKNSPARRKNSPRNYHSPVISGSPYRSDRSGTHPSPNKWSNTADLSASQLFSPRSPRGQRDIVVPPFQPLETASQLDPPASTAKKGWNKVAQAVQAESSNSLHKVVQVYHAARELPEAVIPLPRESSQSARTVWVGGIPDVTANQRGDVALTRAFAECGAVLSVQVRRKDGNRSWAFISFLDDTGLSAALQKTVTVPGDGGLVALEVKKAKVDRHTDGQMKLQWESQERKIF